VETEPGIRINVYMLDYSYVGQKTFDVLRVVNWIRSFGHKEVHIAGKGWGSNAYHSSN